MRLSQDEIERLYSEESVSQYRPEAVMAELADGAQVPALCFNLLQEPGRQERNPDYARQLRDLGCRLGFPSEYVDRIA